MHDIIGAVAAYLKTDAHVAELIEDRLFIGRIPHAQVEAEDTFRPRKMIVIRQAGGVGKRDLLPIDFQRMDVICYGETMFDADSVRRAVWDVLTRLDRVRSGDVLIHHVNPVSGALSSVDPDIVWPIVVQSYQVLAATEV